MAPATSASGTPDYRNLLIGGVLQVVEAATLGMPFEVWKTRNGAYTKESAAQSFRAVYATGGAKAFWRGSQSKMLEAFSKGAVLVFAKQYILDICIFAGMARDSFWTGAIAGAGGGVCQTVVMSPLTYVVTYGMKNPEKFKDLGTFGVLQQAGLRGCYSSAPAMMMRQASNWALRQGFNDAIAGQAKHVKGGNLTVPEKTLCAFLAGACSCINQPTEVLRIRVQAEYAGGNKAATTTSAARAVFAEAGFLGFYAGLIPRIGLAAWQTLFMCTFVDMVNEAMRASDKKKAASH